MGPASAKRFPGRRGIRPDPTGERRGRATPASADGRRGAGYVDGACPPATGAARTAPDPARKSAHFVDVLGQVAAWLDPTVERVCAIVANLSRHRTLDVRRWALAHPRGEFGFPPTAAASRNLSEPWGTIRRALARKGRRVATWAAVGQAVAAGTAYWNRHRPPFGWGRRQARRRPRKPGVTRLPLVA
jgi:hypothetical protein